jgi:hypothetical protein
LFLHGYFWTDLSHWLTPWLSGQRCLRYDLLRYLPPQAAQGYGFETCLTVLARQRKWRVKHVPWTSVSHPLGHLSRNGWSGFQRKTKMYRDILSSWLTLELNPPRPGKRQYKIRRNP